MTIAPIFISHRTEYARIARGLTQMLFDRRPPLFPARHVFRNKDFKLALCPGQDEVLEAESLFLIYGAPYEDWSWCFYEAGYFAADITAMDKNGCDASHTVQPRDLVTRNRPGPMLPIGPTTHTGAAPALLPGPHAHLKVASQRLCQSRRQPDNLR